MESGNVSGLNDLISKALAEMKGEPALVNPAHIPRERRIIDALYSLLIDTSDAEYNDKVIRVKTIKLIKRCFEQFGEKAVLAVHDIVMRSRKADRRDRYILAAIKKELQDRRWYGKV